MVQNVIWLRSRVVVSSRLRDHTTTQLNDAPIDRVCLRHPFLTPCFLQGEVCGKIHSMKKRVATLLLLVALALLSGCSKPHVFNGTTFDESGPAFDFAGVNYDGSPFHLSDQHGKVVLIFFGYTFCPDVCPFTLADMNTLATQLGEQAADVAFVFVTVDPERDTLEKLATYIPSFNPDFYGVRLEGEMYERTKTAYGVYVEKRPVEGSEVPGGYFVDHTGIIYVIDKAGNLAEVFPPGSDAATMQPDVEYWLEQ